MLEDVVRDYAAYFKVDVCSGFQAVQDVIDNMLTRLEELTSVLQMIKLKNSDCCSAVTEDINKYRSEITILSRKVNTLCRVIEKLQCNMDVLENQVEKAEIQFGVSNGNKITSFLKPFLKKNRSPSMGVSSNITSPIKFQSVLDSFDNK